MKRETKGESEFWYAGGVIGLGLMLLAITLTLAARCAR